jgi:hydrogenase nickel incorporation protein HypA/HybF
LHELAIAGSVVEIAGRHADGRRVTKVFLKVGHLRQVVPSSLAFSFQLVSQGTPVEGAELEMEEIPGSAKCRECGEENLFTEFPLQCAACGAFDLEILQGEELYVESLELEEQELTSRNADKRGPERLERADKSLAGRRAESRRRRRAD